MNEKILYTRGDDCGISIETNFAIYIASKYGILKNISLIPVSPYIQYAYTILKDIEDISFGFHVTLTCEWKNIKWGPILDRNKVSSLVDENGYFYPDGKTMFEKRVERKDMEKEIEAQLEYLEGIGFKISYLDIHMGIEWVNNIEEFILELCKKKKIIFIDKRYKKIPYHNFNFDKFLSNLENLKSGEYLLITHPVFYTEEISSYSTYWENGDAIIEKRKFDLMILTDDRVKKMIERKKIKLERFKRED
ncbi:MAG: ChbG/HpnK family deacetylase [Candidatus Omnitrophica bacterium]|nr:ChbG/HpnK family deacetylase [Candidatus Omnitrophota bacterium]MCM8803008.1 ChbG/HpnK family deacetylase [Candidatus Omnitrophota bacterium]